jgi:hypothetical protein
VRELVTTARQPSTIASTPSKIIGGTTMNGTVAESTYANGDEGGKGFPSLSSKLSDVVEMYAPGHGSVAF